MDIVFEKYKEGSIECYELLRKKNMGIKEFILDMFLDSLLSLKDALTVEGEYYLFIYKDKCTLLVKKKQEIIREVDVTNCIDRNIEFKKFKLDGYTYKKYRKL